MRAAILEISGKTAEVMAAVQRISARLPEGSTLVAVMRVPGRPLTPREQAGAQAMGATDVPCSTCAEACWWGAASRSVPGPLVPVCHSCIGTELDRHRAEQQGQVQ